MKKYLLVFGFIIFSIVPISCEGGEKETDPETTDPKEEILPTEEEMLSILRETGRYNIGEHPCTVPVSTDCYVYPQDVTGDYLVPMALIDSISTLGLVETILENPRFPAFLLESDLEKFYYFSFNNPGLLEELNGREDAARVLIGRYLGMYFSCNDNNYSSKLGKGVPEGYVNPKSQIYYAYYEIHLLIAQYDILYKATPDEIISLSVKLASNYLLGEEIDDAFHLYTGPTIIWLAARIMLIEEYGPFFDLIESEGYPHMDNLNNPQILSPQLKVKYMLLFNDFIGELMK